MKLKLRGSFMLLLLLFAGGASAQIGPRPFEEKKDTTRKPKAVFGETESKTSGSMQVSYSEGTKPTVFETDSTGDMWIRYSDSGAAPSKPIYRGLIHSGRGFRVQIYSGNDRKKAIQAKATFMQRYPRIRTYLSYAAPQFRVKVGNFKSREEAAGLRHMLTSLFNPVMIVPDVIIVNTMKQ